MGQVSIPQIRTLSLVNNTSVFSGRSFISNVYNTIGQGDLSLFPTVLKSPRDLSFALDSAQP